MMSQHPDRVLFARSLDPAESIENFDPIERVTLDMLGRGLVQRWSAAFFQHEAGVLDTEQWEMWITHCHSFLVLPVWAAWWDDEKMQPGHPHRFLVAIDSAPVMKLSSGASIHQ